MDTQDDLIERAEYMVKMHPDWLWAKTMAELVEALKVTRSTLRLEMARLHIEQGQRMTLDELLADFDPEKHRRPLELDR